MYLSQFLVLVTGRDSLSPWDSSPSLPMDDDADFEETLESLSPSVRSMLRSIEPPYSWRLRHKQWNRSSVRHTVDDLLSHWDQTPSLDHWDPSLRTAMIRIHNSFYEYGLEKYMQFRMALALHRSGVWLGWVGYITMWFSHNTAAAFKEVAELVIDINDGHLRGYAMPDMRTAPATLWRQSPRVPIPHAFKRPPAPEIDPAMFGDWQDAQEDDGGFHGAGQGDFMP